MNLKMEVEVLTHRRVKHLEARWHWLQERTRSTELHVGTVDTTVNSALGTKFHPRRRFDELLLMLPLGIGVFLMSLVAEEHRTERDNCDALVISYSSAMDLLWRGRQCKMTTSC